MESLYQADRGYSNPSIERFKLHPTLSELKAPQYGLWAFCRGLDKAGSGFAVVRLEEVASIFGIHPGTVYRWLKSGMGTWWHDWCNLGAAQIRIQYKAIARIHIEQQLKPGECAIVPIQYLSRAGRKAAVAEIKAIVAHKQAIFSAKRSSNRRERNCIDASESFRSNSSDSLAGASKSRRFLILNANAPNCPHGSLKSMSRQLGRSVRCLQNRLSNHWRIKKGLPRLDRTRIIRELSPIQKANYLENKRRHQYQGDHPLEIGPDFFVNPLSQSAQFVRQLGDRFYFLGGNVYDSPLEVRANRYEKARIRWAFKSLVGG